MFFAIRFSATWITTSDAVLGGNGERPGFLSIWSTVVSESRRRGGRGARRMSRVAIRASALTAPPHPCVRALSQLP
ncbi:hypothetical protein DMC30DRAFT_387036 [Rhodotorula diobovata]|uniref:Uncharacterized protein n=1 Tax=Rhodotorula diobovata TaxID=5288 RepID=A0A5C5G5E4_9BASI|nr:hypothetical protein DMC30DRAFT_387036 [Rhodotorula diobovata]